MKNDWRLMIGGTAAFALFILGLFVSSCSRKAAPAAPAAPEVLVTTVQPRDVPRILERVATLDGFINANINAQVQGYIISRDYQEGSLVKKGDLLFQIDPRPFEAALAQAKGTLAKDQANQAKADADEKRARDLFKKKVISDSERDTAIAAADSSKANVEADEAAVETAELNLGYTKITAPINGLAGFANSQVGDLVGPATTTPLTTVSQIDPIKAIVTVGEAAFTDFFARYPDLGETPGSPQKHRLRVDSRQWQSLSAKRKVLRAGSKPRPKNRVDPLLRDLSKSRRHFAAGTIWESAIRPGRGEKRARCSAGGGD